MDLQKIQAAKLKKDLPELKPGMVVRVHQKIKEAGKERIQIFEGMIISKRGSGLSMTITVRKISYGVGVERIFPIHSPTISKIEAVRQARVRKAKLYHLRDSLARKLKETPI